MGVETEHGWGGSGSEVVVGGHVAGPVAGGGGGLVLCDGGVVAGAFRLPNLDVVGGHVVGPVAGGYRALTGYG